ncbi:hypothetical protein [Polymorphospora lycopeni]|uniref:SLATT domain-containing protein n=1 Tax=Polymorphospora lycopeni TaxID=3140240 RepID=A0ABV5D1T7_9ACTN
MTDVAADPELTASDLRRMIETARWHILRYDALRASIANRASLLISGNALLIGGVAILFPNTVGQDVAGGRLTLVALAIGAFWVLGCSVFSVIYATKALLAGKSWRELYGQEPPVSLFYQHSDTMRVAPDFASFDTAFVEQTLGRERESATVNLWVVLQAHNYRYQFLRRATRRLQLGLVVFAGSVVVAVALSLIKLWS